MISFVAPPSIDTAIINEKPVVSIAAVITESLLTRVGAVVNWGDGLDQTVGQAVKPLNLALTHTYKQLGTYTVTIVATNYASPVPASVSWTGSAAFASPGYQPTNTALQPAYVGPIMPSMTGYPSPDQWNWQFGADNACLVSSLTLLLSTAKGERLMDAQFGTNLRQLVFSLEGPILTDAIFNDVSQAVATYEPRAQLTDISATTSGRVITVNAAFLSLINNQQISLLDLTMNPS